MFFRPEEIHCASGIGDVFEPLPKRDRCVRYQAFRFGTLDYTILHLHSDRQPTVETGGVDLNRLSWKEPADRQRLESSLGEPFLLSLDSDSILSGKIVKRSE